MSIEPEKPLNYGELPYEQDAQVIDGDEFYKITINGVVFVSIVDAEMELMAMVPEQDADKYVRLFNTYQPVKAE